MVCFVGCLVQSQELDLIVMGSFQLSVYDSMKY